jgi:type II secretory pathway pseudopilin PulG
MPNLGKRIFAIASPVVVLVVSVGIFARYAESAGPEMLIATVIIGGLVAFGVLSVVRTWRERKAALAAAQRLTKDNPKAALMLVEVDRRAVRQSQRSGAGLRGLVKPEMLVALFGGGQVDLYRPAGRELVASLAPGAGIARISTTTINRGTPVDEPCLRIEFADGEWIDLVLYDATTGKWPRQEDLDKITSG